MQTLFKKFNITTVLKKTEFSSVYLADHILLEKQIILKTLDSEKVIDRSDLLRFQREAQILAKLDHPNIIQVLDYGSYENFVYISFEYFEAHTLRELINKGKLNKEQKTALLKQAVRGLSYAHKNNIIHRDIKPENILVDVNYLLKIADFGLALSDESRGLTDPKSIMGTPAYASPEQVSGATLTPASDLFSLGLIAFELFNKYNPILGKDITQTINNIINFDQQKYDKLVAITSENEKPFINNLLNPDPILRRIPAILAENDSQIPVGKMPFAVKGVWVFPLLAIFVVVIFYFFYRNSADNTLKESKEILLKDTVTASELPPQISKLNAPPAKAEQTGNRVAGINEKDAYLQIIATPPAQLYINSENYGRTTADKSIKLKKGLYRITLENTDFPEYQQDIELQTGEQRILNIDLKKQSGILKVFTFPWAVVEINDKNFGQTPLEKPIRLKKGSYTLQLKNPGFDAYRKTFKINGADTILVQHNFVNPGLGIIIE